MNCKKAEEYLVDYLYQELPAKKTLEIEKHLRECSTCTATLDSWRAIHRAYQRSTEEPLVAPYTKQKVLAIAEQELLRPRPWSEKLLWAFKLAAVPIAIFILVLFLNSKKDPTDMALHQPEPETRVTQRSERVAATPQPKPGLEGKRQQKLSEAEPKLRAERSVYTDDLRSRLNEEARSDKDAADLKKKDESTDAGGNEFDALPSSAPEPPPPAASAPLESQAEMEQQYAPAQAAGRSATKVSAISRDAEETFQEAQKQLQSNKVKEGQKSLEEAVKLDDSKALAGQLHQEGNFYQSRGEHVNAIMNFEKVQANYRDYARIDEVLIRLGDSYSEVGQYERAAQAYSQVRSQKNVARERIQRLQKKQEANEQLKALGYVSEPKKQ